MTDEQLAKYIQERYRKYLEFYDKRAISNQRGYRVCAIYIMVMSVALGPLIAFDDQLCGWGIPASKVLGPTIAIAAGITAHFQFHENWLRYRSTWDALQHELAYYEAGIYGYDDPSTRASLFVERVEGLITDEGASWRRTHAIKDPGRA